MNRACSRSRLRNPGGFSPLSMFGAGEQGAWYDPSDLTTLFQDAAGTTPVTAADQPVGLMRDKSGRGNHFTQSTAASRPILRNSGVLWSLEFDGVDDFLLSASIDFTATDKITAFAGLRKLSDAALGCVAELGDGLPVGSFLISAPFAASATFGLSMRAAGAAFGSPTAGFASPVSAVLGASLDAAAVTALLRVNGVAGVPATGAAGSSTFGNYPLYAGRRGGTTSPFRGHLYGLIVRGAASSASETIEAEKYLAVKSGVTL